MQNSTSVLIFGFFFLFLISAVHAISVSYDVFGTGGTINSLNATNANMTAYTPKKSTFAGYFYNITSSSFAANASYVSTGVQQVPKVFKYKVANVTKMVNQPVEIGLFMFNASSCTSFQSNRILCEGAGVMKVKNKKTGITETKDLTLFRTDISRSSSGTANISGSNSTHSLFNISNIQLSKFSQNLVVFDNDAILQVQYSDGSGQLNFPPLPINNVSQANNTVIIKNIGVRNSSVYVCGTNFPGNVQFKVQIGTNMTGYINLPACNGALPFDGAIKLTKGFDLTQNKWLQISNARMTFTSAFTQGTLTFRGQGVV